MLKDQIQQDLKAAMRAKDAVRLRTVRSLRAALQTREIALREGGEAELSEQEELAVVQKQAKQRRDAIEQYEAAGRDDLAAKEREELAVIEEYLPQQLGDDAIRAVLHEVIAATGAASPRDVGKVMGAAIKRLRGRADGRRINELARELLSGSNA
ncbi:MAG: GatB/YqeY domain-containing protein [Rhodothermales bacterium]|nr:GatB/YqeY domain-containing protein [Rhodothermales bacterium]